MRRTLRVLSAAALAGAAVTVAAPVASAEPVSCGPGAAGISSQAVAGIATSQRRAPEPGADACAEGSGLRGAVAVAPCEEGADPAACAGPEDTAVQGGTLEEGPDGAPAGEPAGAGGFPEDTGGAAEEFGAPEAGEEFGAAAEEFGDPAVEEDLSAPATGSATGVEVEPVEPEPLHEAAPGGGPAGGGEPGHRPGPGAPGEKEPGHRPGPGAPGGKEPGHRPDPGHHGGKDGHGRTAPPVHRGVEAGAGGAFTDSVPLQVAGGLLIAGAAAAAGHRIRQRLAPARGGRLR